MELEEFSAKELAVFEAQAQARYEEYCGKGLSLNMARGKPAPEQLDLSDELFDLTREKVGVSCGDGTDCRNYGLAYGIDESRKLFGEILGADPSNVIACGNSSLNLMFDYISQCCTHGVCGSEPWLFCEDRKMIAVVPGYDRHFAVGDYFGFKLVSVPMTPTGPDMDKIEELVKDPSVKVMFCVPKYSNPDGVTYSAETVERLASMKTAAEDFRIIWDNAYALHSLYEDRSDELVNVFDVAAKYGNEDRFIAVASTAKITFAGAGISAIAASDKNIAQIKSRISWQIISYDKINQLKHAFLYKSVDDVKLQMKKHADILRPKFDKVLEVFERELSGLGIAEWTKPNGGYFISLNVNIGSAKYVGELCAKSGLTLTPVGATFPYGIDPDDRNIRIAPSYPSVAELEIAAEIVAVAVKLAACKALKK